MINYAIFKNLDDKIITIDRETTGYRVISAYDNVYHMEMTWYSCYEWSDEQTGHQLDDNLRFIAFDIEDEADDGYFARVINYNIIKEIDI